MNQFITIIAWTFAVLASLHFLLNVIAIIRYASSRSQLQINIEKLQGKVPNFRFSKAFIIAFLCWAWIYTNPLA